MDAARFDVVRTTVSMRGVVRLEEPTGNWELNPKFAGPDYVCSLTQSRRLDCQGMGAWCRQYVDIRRVPQSGAMRIGIA